MEVTSEGLPWDSNDRIAWRNFLSSQAGTRLIPKILESVPSLLPSGDVNAVLIRSGEVRGFQSAIQTALYLISELPTQKLEQVAYPPPEDDRQWDDGQKLTT